MIITLTKKMNFMAVISLLTHSLTSDADSLTQMLGFLLSLSMSALSGTCSDQRFRTTCYVAWHSYDVRETENEG